jgi:hypothetical protein
MMHVNEKGLLQVMCRQQRVISAASLFYRRGLEVAYFYMAAGSFARCSGIY